MRWLQLLCLHTQVRASSLQELVYKGGQAGVTKATVTITFDNTDKKQSPLGYETFDELTVTRQVCALDWIQVVFAFKITSVVVKSFALFWTIFCWSLAVQKISKWLLKLVNRIRLQILTSTVWQFRMILTCQVCIGQTSLSASVYIVSVYHRVDPASLQCTDESLFIIFQVVIGGRNKYLINGCNANNTRVQDLFRSVQLNVNNPHFLIMQVQYCVSNAMRAIPGVL